MLELFYSTPRPCRPTGNILSISSPHNSQPNGWRSSQELIAIPFVIVLSLSKTSTACCVKKLEPPRMRSSPTPWGTGERNEMTRRENRDWRLLYRWNKDSGRHRG